MFSHDAQPDPAGDVDLGPIDQPAPEIAEAPFEGDLAPLEDPHSERVLGPGIEHRDVPHPDLGEQPAQLEVDLPGGELGGIEAGLFALDLRDPGHLGGRL